MKTLSDIKHILCMLAATITLTACASGQHVGHLAVECEVGIISASVCSAQVVKDGEITYQRIVASESFFGQLMRGAWALVTLGLASGSSNDITVNGGNSSSSSASLAGASSSSKASSASLAGAQAIAP